MADQTKQIQTTAAPQTSGSPAGTPASAATTTQQQKPVETGDPAMDALARAFAQGDPEPEGTEQQAPPTQTSPQEGEEETPETTESNPEGQETPDTEGEDEVDPNGNPEELDPQAELTVPKGLENMPKWIQKRFSKFAEVNRELRTQLKAAAPIVITPTPLSPLSDVDTSDALTQRYETAKKVKVWAAKHPDGATIKRNGVDVELNAEEVRAELARAEAVIEAYPDRKIELAEREKTRPWEAAERILPDMFKPGSDESKAASHLLQTCPELKTRFTDWETVVAFLIKGHKIATEEASGKVRYMRMELDDKGNPVLPKPKDSAKGSDKPKPKAPTTPQSTKPALQQGNKGSTSVADAVKALPADADPETRARTALAAAFAS